MVLKGQVFMLDVSFAFIVLLLSLFSFASTFLLLNKQLAGDYNEFSRQRRLLDASEKLIAVDLAERSENTLKHHVLSMERIAGLAEKGADEIAEDLILDDYKLYVRLTLGDEVLLEKGERVGGAVIKRVALCGGEICVFEMRAE